MEGGHEIRFHLLNDEAAMVSPIDEVRRFMSSCMR